MRNLHNLIVIVIITIIPKSLTIKNEFPDGFLFGASTASYQIEGAWNEDGKGENIWDKMVHSRPELVKDSANGDVACDSYHKYKEDVAHAKDLNLNFYRFSISWTRIAPTGEMHKLNPKGIDYYNRLINELLANNVEPMVTMYHWDLPQYLQDLGGWVNPIMVDYFTEYAKVLFSNFGDRVKWWITLNEPKETCRAYSNHSYAPYLNLNNTGYYMAGHIQLLAHSKVYHLYNELFRDKQKGKISISISGAFYMPKNESSVDDLKIADRANNFEIGWFSHPIYKGDYSPIMRKFVDRKSKKEGRPWSTLPTFTDEEIKLLIGTADFYALNHYSSRLVTSGSELDPSFNSDAEYSTFVDESWPVSIAPWLIVVPEGLHKLLVWIKNQYNNPPVIITENGYADDGRLNDLERIDYIKSYLKSTLKAIYQNKCNVIGYTCWSLIDNFEWMDGYRYHFGMVHVDFNDPLRQRVPKASYQFYKNVVTNGKLDVQY